MSATGALAGAAVNGIWKAASIVLAGALLVVASTTGTGWWLAADDRDAARAALVKEQGVSAQLRASIGEQNRAVEGMAAATLAAGNAAQQLRLRPPSRERSTTRPWRKLLVRAPQPATRLCRPSGCCWRECDEMDARIAAGRLR